MENQIIKGHKYALLTAISPLRLGGDWVFICDCGATVEKWAKHVLAGKVKSCGCWQIASRSSRMRGKNATDITGKTFGLLTVLSKDIDSQRSKWLTHCLCGNTKVVRLTHLQSGATTSCGCVKITESIKRFTTHGRTKSYEYNSWLAMKARCLNPNHDQYKDYGGRGITICKRWLDSFENFLQDMGDRDPSLSIDRRNNDGNYEPSNCRWATRKEQRANQRIIG